MKKKLIMGLVLMLIVTGCASNSDNEIKKGDFYDVMDNIFNEGFLERVREQNNEEFPDHIRKLDEIILMMIDGTYCIDLETAAEKNNMTVQEYAERLRLRLESRQNPEQLWQWLEREKNTVEHILHGRFIPASDDKSWHEIERFVFVYGHNHVGIEFVLDRMNNKVYFDDDIPFTRSLDRARFSVEFTEQDLESLLNVLDAVNIRDWEREITRPEEIPVQDMKLFGGYTIGILFSDGTIRRWRGWDMLDEDYADGQFLILKDYIISAGADIMRREQSAVPLCHTINSKAPS